MNRPTFTERIVVDIPVLLTFDDDGRWIGAVEVASEHFETYGATRFEAFRRAKILALRALALSAEKPANRGMT